MRPAVFLDRDGVLNETAPHPESGLPESPLRPQDVVLIEGAAAAVAELLDGGWAVVVASNQPSAAKGTATLEDLRAVHHAVRDALPQVDGWRYCLHHPEGDHPLLSRPCACRKPAPGLLLAAAFELDIDLAASWMVGDSGSDVQAGAAAGCRTVLVEYPGSEHRRSGGVPADLTTTSLATVARRLGAPTDID